VIRDSGSPGSFGTPGAERVAHSGPYGILVDGRADYNTIVGNVILDTQTTKTQAAGLRVNSRPHNVVEHNVVSKEPTHPPDGPINP
jgi:hypothetical protein